MSTDPDAELRRVARAMVAEDDPPTIPPWPLDAGAGGSGHRDGRRLWAIAAALILIVGAIAVLVGRSMVDDAAPADAPTSTAAPATVVPGTIASTTTVRPPTTAAPTTAITTPSTSVPVTTVPTTVVTSGLAACEGPQGDDVEYPLQRCDAGLAVAVLKSELIAKGYLPPSSDDDGWLFDDQVDAAVRAFQADQGLAVDGLVGPITWAAITADYQRRVPDPNGDGHLDPVEVGIIGDANEQDTGPGSPGGGA